MIDSFPTSHIEISRHALNTNLEFLRKTLGSDILISSVIKGNAYGHGIEVYLPLAEECGQTHFSVFSAEEALVAHKVRSPETRIMIMGMIDGSAIDWAIENDIEFYVSDIPRLQETISKAKRLCRKAKIQIESETGMHRTGLEFNELPLLTTLIDENSKYLDIEGLCTHYAGAESIANYIRIKQQRHNFIRSAKWLAKMGIKAKKHHTACSAAAMSYPKTRMDMVRIGIMQYGFWSSIETMIHYMTSTDEHIDPLKRLICWKSRIMSTKTIATGEFVGYGTDYLARRNMEVAAIPVGYSQGFSRNLSHQGRVLINGQFADVVGLVNMNLILVDITDIPETKRGSDVTLIGRDGENEISVASFAEFSNQMNYELLTRLPDTIPRIIVD